MNIVCLLDEMMDLESDAYKTGECSLERFKSREFGLEEDANWTVLVNDDSLECHSWYDKVIITRRSDM